MSPTATPLSAINRDALMALVGGCPDLLAELAAIFQDEAPTLVSDMADAIEANDAATLHRLAHTLAGNAGTLGADLVVGPARRLEAMGRTGRLDGAGADLVEARLAVADFCRELSTLIESLPRNARGHR